MTLEVARTMEEEAREKVLAYLKKQNRPLPADEVIVAILKRHAPSLSFETVRRAIVNLLDQGQLALTEERKIALSA